MAKTPPRGGRRSWLRHLCREWTVESRHEILPPFAKPNPETWNDDQLTAAWLGHSTVLINLFGLRILTDPVFSNRIGIRLPFLTIGPKRLTAPALTFAELPPIDVVLLSHAHFDHIDRRSLKLFPISTRVITARGTRDLLRQTRFCDVIELSWGESIRLVIRANGTRGHRLSHATLGRTPAVRSAPRLQQLHPSPGGPPDHLRGRHGD